MTLPDFVGDKEAVTQHETPSLKVGDRISYQGEGRFCLRGWACRKYVKAGDIGVVVEQGTDTRPWVVKPGEDLWWKVDFGEGRVVTISLYDLRIQLYRKEESDA